MVPPLRKAEVICVRCQYKGTTANIIINGVQNTKEDAKVHIILEYESLKFKHKKSKPIWCGCVIFVKILNSIYIYRLPFGNIYMNFALMDKGRPLISS